jgi:F0F1-type ATP synthase assembly protein I
MRDPLVGVGLIIQLTIMIVVAVLAPVLLGIFLDRLLHTSPIITLFMTLVGITLGTVGVYRRVNAIYNSVAGGKK